ncbi:MAG TPA: TetR/AcrR family transcriptional regulator [Acidimicrobiales bacterium]|jgi:AcrR family transcriptional regulator|nr:TetR/AcrR family transcriptional regulator [Acidimicrobiales bacterium]
MSQLRWGTEVPNDMTAARERLIDAAEACFRRFGVMKTTIEDVARIAQVSRATVYRYFASRDELILGVLLREGNRFLERLSARIADVPELSDAIVEGVLFTIRAIQSDENLALLFAPEAAGITTSIAGASEALFDMTAHFLRPYFETAQQSGTLRAGVDLDEAAEWVLRAILSMVTFDGPRQRRDDDLRRYLWTFLAPALVAGPATAPSPRPRRREPLRSR